MSEAFTVSRILDGLRFDAPDGWVELKVHGDGRGTLWTGTKNGATAEVFGAKLWKLLSTAMLELGLKVVSVDTIPDPFVEYLLVCSGFQRDGTRRRWKELADGSLSDLVMYSILDSEVKFEAKEPEVENGERPISAE